MGYACPVCDVPQRDGEHLAHHLAFTAMIHGDEHETWLDEHAPGWNESTPAELADAVVPEAAETEYEDVFEDTVPRGQDGRGDPTHAGVDVASGDGDGVDGETRAVLEEARDLTRQMLADDADDGSDDPDADGDEGGDADAN